MVRAPRPAVRRLVTKVLSGLILVAGLAVILVMSFPRGIVGTDLRKTAQDAVARISSETARIGCCPCLEDSEATRLQGSAFSMDTSGSNQAITHLRWAPDASLEEVRDNWLSGSTRRAMALLDKNLAPSREIRLATAGHPAPR